MQFGHKLQRKQFYGIDPFKQDCCDLMVETHLDNLATIQSAITPTVSRAYKLHNFVTWNHLSSMMLRAARSRWTMPILASSRMPAAICKKNQLVMFRNGHFLIGTVPNKRQSGIEAVVQTQRQQYKDILTIKARESPESCD